LDETGHVIRGRGGGRKICGRLRRTRAKYKMLMQKIKYILYNIQYTWPGKIITISINGEEIIYSEN
jgi:hypothetical protein